MNSPFAVGLVMPSVVTWLSTDAIPDVVNGLHERTFPPGSSPLCDDDAAASAVVGLIWPSARCALRLARNLNFFLHCEQE